MSTFGNKVFKGSGGIRSFAPAADENAGSVAPDFDTDAVLEALAQEHVNSQVDLARAMRVTPTAIRPKFVELWNKGFIRGEDGKLDLTESGQRVLTYSKMAKF